MSATATQPLLARLSAQAFAEQQPDSDRACGHGGLTLEERISGVWEGLLRTGTAGCPVCRGRMERAGARGHCVRCGSVLS